MVLRDTRHTFCYWWIPVLSMTRIHPLEGKKDPTPTPIHTPPPHPTPHTPHPHPNFLTPPNHQPPPIVHKAWNTPAKYPGWERLHSGKIPVYQYVDNNVSPLAVFVGSAAVRRSKANLENWYQMAWILARTQAHTNTHTPVISKSCTYIVHGIIWEWTNQHVFLKHDIDIDNKLYAPEKFGRDFKCVNFKHNLVLISWLFK